MAPARLAALLFAPIAAAAALALPALGHAGLGGSAVETRFTFPPWLVWAAGAAVVAVSFGIVGGYLSREAHVRPGAGGPARSASAYERQRPAPGLTVGRAVGLAVLFLVALNAFRPASDSLLPQVVVWLVLWGLFPLLSYTIGNVWHAVSPFEALKPLTIAARGHRAPRRLPAWVGSWPATLLLLVVIGLEVSEGPWANDPSRLALVVFAYVFLTLVGMTLFGDAWLAEAEVFTRSFVWWHAAAPLSMRRGRFERRGISGTLERLPLRGVSDVAFTVALLFGVNYDAFLATGFGESALSHAREFGIPFAAAALVLAGFGLFLGAWMLAARGIRDKAEAHKSVRHVAERFAASLIPIAVGYHLAHNMFMLIENAPRFVLAVLDPLGFAGWPGDAVHLPSSLVFAPGVLGALAALQIVFILTGHVLAVIVAHKLAFQAFPSRIQAVRSEVPLTLVMVAYTWTGLWLLSAGHGGGAA